MRFFAIAADVALGVFLGIFCFAVLTRFWPSLERTAVALVVVAASILVVLFRQPNGSLAVKRDRT
jgi:hypothetical protein